MIADTRIIKTRMIATTLVIYTNLTGNMKNLSGLDLTVNGWKKQVFLGIYMFNPENQDISGLKGFSLLSFQERACRPPKS